MTDAPVAGRFRTTRVLLRASWETDRRGTVLAFGCVLGEAIVTGLFAYWLKLLLDGVQQDEPNLITWAAAGMVVSITGGVALQYAGERASASLNERAHHEVERRLLRTIARVPTLEIHETPDHLSQLELLDSESWEFGHTIPAVVRFFHVLIQIAITAGLLASVDPLLLVLPAFGIPVLVFSRYTNGLFVRGQLLAADPTRRAEDIYELCTQAGPAKELRLFRLRDELLDRFAAAHREIVRIHLRLQLRGQAVRLLTRLVFVAGYFGAIAYVVVRAVDGRVSVGDVGLTAVLAGQVLGLVAGSAETVQWALRSLTTASRYVYLVDVAERIRSSTDTSAVAPARLTTGIRLRGLTYRYPSAEEPTLRGIDLDLPAGSTVAVVGDNGAGKTTLVKVLAGLYRPDAGSITADGVDLAQLDPDRWRERVSAGFQDHAQWEFSVREAVGIGDLDAIDDADAAGAALERAGAGDLPGVLPQGVETQLGPRWPDGVDLSSGQWQKIALGRAMIRTSPLLLLLDEPTAALDADTEHQLFERWTHAAQELRRTSGAITVLVSHRFSTVRMADLIVVLADGVIAEHGTHDDLMERNGQYARLFSLQAAAYR